MTKPKTYQRCKICEKELKIYSKTYTGSADGTRSMQLLDSEEGVLFKDNMRGGVWFCNNCWKEIIEHYESSSEVYGFLIQADLASTKNP